MFALLLLLVLAAIIYCCWILSPAFTILWFVVIPLIFIAYGFFAGYKEYQKEKNKHKGQ